MGRIWPGGEILEGNKHILSVLCASYPWQGIARKGFEKKIIHYIEKIPCSK